MLASPYESATTDAVPTGTVPVGWGHEPLHLGRGLPMSGFAARTAHSRGSLDPAPEAVALAVGDEVVVALDVIGVDRQLADLVNAEADLPNPVLLTATHTHAGPGILPGRLGEHSEQARKAVAKAAAVAARRALDSRRDCTLEWFDPEIPGLAHDRRKAVVSPDARLRALRWRSGDQVAGYLVSYPCHPTVIGPANLYLSPDYPGYLRLRMQEATGCPVLFLTGCAGDINAGHSVTKSFHLDESGGRTPGDADLFGTTLADNLLAGQWQALDLSGGLTAGRTEVDVTMNPLDTETPAELRQRWEQELRSADEGTRALLRSWIAWAGTPEAGRSTDCRLPVARLGIGEASIVFLPGEPFLAADLALGADPASHTIVGGYYLDTPGYLPDAASYPLGGYEVLDAHRYYGMPAPFAAGSLEALVAAARTLTRAGDER
ncbi:hypothetical protein GCM10009785_15240 [Brooklawnia cerclae]|uniref:Neutral/alkaline non-lysosomal ceramidase N-terminal domain-containing protein n=1 Tax=Brooklawnia cerclae TaxID=349934 RepID=A0ABX0SHL9_9ACTN|nr:hypothetical protein [Brooklawnia cerclae]NIH57904.1 hypothetical protein [Brooklawnia cerclae]